MKRRIARKVMTMNHQDYPRWQRYRQRTRVEAMMVVVLDDQRRRRLA